MTNKKAETEVVGKSVHGNASASTRANQGAFLAAFSKTCSISAAAEAADIGRATHYLWMKEDAEYAVMFEGAKILAHQLLEDTAVDRAVVGWDEPVFHDGKQCGLIRKRSDRLLEILLKAKKPTEYRERIDHEVTGKGGAPLIPVGAIDALIRKANAGE